MKWITNGIKFNRGCYNCLIAKFDNSKMWLTLDAACTVQTAKASFKRLGEHFGAKCCEVQKMYNVSGTLIRKDTDIVSYYINSDDEYVFRRELEVPEGALRQFEVFSADEVFIMPTSC